jgi:hypothetical protein
MVKNTMSKTAVLIPSYKRGYKLNTVVDNLKKTTTDYTLYFILEKDDLESINECKNLDCKVIINSGYKTFASCINQAYNETTEPYLFLSADDCVYHQCWLDEAMKLMDEKTGVVGTDDMSGNPVIKSGKMSVNSLVSRKYLQEHTGTMDRSYPFLYNYGHNFTDQELVETAQHRGMYKHAFNSKVQHLHWVHGTAPMDATYQTAIDRNAKDTETFNSRKHLWGN